MTQRIALATISLNNMAGGLERNIVNLANFLCDQGVDVDLLTFDLPGAKCFYELDNKVTWHMLGSTAPHQGIGFWERVQLIRNIRKVLSAKHSFSHLVCFHHGILIRFYLATLFCRIQIICSERNALTMYDYNKASKWNKNFLILFLVNKITVQFPAYVKLYPHLLQNRIKVVHNPVFPTMIPESVKRDKMILSVGRHVTQKRFDLLINACKIVFRKYPDWSLNIVGDGPLTSCLKKLVAQVKLRDQVKFISPMANLDVLYSQARFYCQPSEWEGFPNAQAEAMSSGVIPIGFSSTRGVTDLIKDRVNGYLSSGPITVEELAETIITAIDAKDEYDNLSKNARLVTQIYSIESWQQSWKEILSL